MLKTRKLSMAVAGALALAGASTANAGIGFKAGEWDIDFSGNVNGFATYNDCDDVTGAVNGGLACNEPPGTKTSVTSIQSGLLPSALVFSAKSRQMDLDVGVTIGVYPTIASDPGGALAGTSGNRALGDSSLNIRQNFLTFGDASWGNVKIGRDLGLFASDAILSDMTLLGVGSGAAFLGGSTTLGRIGVGYIYSDWLPQITYSSPSYSGFQVAAGMFQTFANANVIMGADPTTAFATAATTPAWQAKVSYDSKANVADQDVAFKLWAGYLYNNPKTDGTGDGSPAGGIAPAGLSASGNAWEVGGRLGVYGAELVAYWYDASGVGTTGIGNGAASFICLGVIGPGGVCTNGNLQKRDSKGGYVQLTYKFQDFKIGYSYGQSKLSQASNEVGAFANPDLLSKNSSNIVGLYYSLTKSLNLVGEWVGTEAEAQGGTKISDNAFILGAILFF